MSGSTPKCAINMDQRLAALRRDQEIDGLRTYLIKYNLFPRNRDPKNSPIRIEELKELVKHWKLHRQRGFWRDHPEKDDLVRALLQHIKNEATNKIRRQEAQEKYRLKSDVESPKKELSIMFGETANKDQRIGGKRMGGDLFYQRGDYNEGLIYLSRTEKSKVVLCSNDVSDDSAQRSSNMTDAMDKTRTSHTEHNYQLTKEMKVKCAEGIYSISCHKGHEMRMLREGVLHTLMSIVKVEDTVIRLYCAAALLNLSASKEAQTKMIEEGAIVTLLELSHTPNMLVKQLCAQALFRFSSDELYQFRLVQEGAVGAISQLMTLPNDEMKEACMNALINLASVPRATTSDSIINTLVHLAKTAKYETLTICAKGLLNLSILATTRSNIVEEGAMVALGLLSAAKRTDLYEQVSCIMCNLAAIKTNQEQMVKNGALTILIDIIDAAFAQKELEDPDEDVESLTENHPLRINRRIRKNCINTLAFFCCHMKLQYRIVSAGFVPRLIRLMQEKKKSMDDDEMEKFCVLCLANLAVDDRSRAFIVQDGVVSILVNILQDKSKNDAILMKLDCVTALSNLMLHPKNFRRMVDEGVIPALIALTELEDNRDIQKASISAMLNLAKDPGMKTKLAEQGAIAAIISFASKYIKNSELCGICVSFINHLSSREENHQALLFEGAVGLIIRVLQRPNVSASAKHHNAEDPDIVYSLWLECISSLSNLASHDAGQKSLVDDGVIEALQHFLGISAADSRRLDKKTEVNRAMAHFSAATILFKLREIACETPAFFTSLLLLVSQSVTRSSLADKNTISYQKKTALSCAFTFARVSLLPKGPRLLASNVDVAPSLNSMMRTGLHEAQVCAAVTLCNMATERGSLIDRIWRDNTVEDFIVITLLRVNSNETKEICAKALFNLLTHEDTRDKMVKDGCLYALIKLARLENEEIRDLSLRSIYNISLDPTKVPMLLEMEIMRILAKMYHSEFSKEMKRLICGILSNLSSVSGHENQLIREGALQVLKSLVKVRDPESKVYAANVLHNLSCAPEVADILVRDECNVLSIIVTLLKSEHKDVRRYSATTIRNLSSSLVAISLMTQDESISMVSVLNDIMKRCMGSCITTTYSCIFALRNLFSHSQNQRKFVECNGIQTLANILSAREMENEATSLNLATEMLCALANMDSEMGERLVSDGIIRVLMAIAKRGEKFEGKISSMNIITSLSNLSKNTDCHELMLRDGVLDAITFLCCAQEGAKDARQVIKTLVPTLGEEFSHHCVVTLRNLSRPPEKPSPKKVSIISSTDDNSNLTSANNSDIKGQRLASQPGIVSILLGLCQSTSPETREHAVITINNLASHRRCRAQLIKCDGVKILLRLANSSTPLIRHICGLALQSLSAHNDTNIVQDGLVSSIAALIELNNEILVAAAKHTTAIVIPSPTTSGKIATGGKDPKEVNLLTSSTIVVRHNGAPADWQRVNALSLPEHMENETEDDYSDNEEHEDSSKSSTKAELYGTYPRACNTDIVLGCVHMITDNHLEKIKIPPQALEVELAPRKLSIQDELPKLRPTTAPETDPVVSSFDMDTPTSLAQVRREAVEARSISTAASPTRARKSRALEPLQ